MSLPRATAEYSLYRSTRQYQYRAVAGGTRADAGARSASACMDRCTQECAQDGLFPDECSVRCNDLCRNPRPHYEYCPPGTKECFRTGMRPHCCPEAATCCRYYDRVTLQERLQCCGPGQECCANIYSGCYDPRLQQCTPSGIWDCPSSRILCRGACCGVGEVCTPSGCCPPEGCSSEEPTCERDIRCTDPTQIAVGTWPACGCIPPDDPENSSDEGPDSGDFGGLNPGPGGVKTCEQFFECPPRYQMDVENDVCVCK